MNRETIKSIVLAALVILSLIQTYSIWTYQGNFEAKSAAESPNIKPIAPENDLNFSDVVKPFQLLHINADDKSVLGSYGTMVDTVYNKVLNMKWTVNISDNVPSQYDAYEMVFPAPLIMETIQTLFDFGQRKTTIRQDWLIDRIRIYQLESQTLLAFMDANEDVKFTATSPDVLFKKDGDYYDKNFYPCHRVALKGKVVYIPKTALTLEKLTYPFTLVDIKEFKPIFFNNLLRTYYSHGAYTDGNSLLKQDDDSYVLRYVNPATGGNTVISDPIYKGYSFIDSHSGWTDKNFVYDYFDSRPEDNEDSVDFRLMRKGLPVYSVSAYPSEAMISLSWENGILNKVDRTLIKIGGSALSSEPETIYSGEDLLAILSSSHILSKFLEDLRIGYRMEINASSHLVNLVPDWFFKTNGQWVSLEDYISRTSQGNGKGDGE